MRCRESYFGGVVDGAAGLGAAGFAGTLAGAPVGAGAATPDDVLYASTIALVMSTPSPDHRDVYKRQGEGLQHQLLPESVLTQVLAQNSTTLPCIGK